MVALRHLEDFTLAGDGRGFCNRWLKKWFLSLLSAPWIRGTVWGEMIHWAWDCRGFCKRWQQKWFLFASSSWGYVGEDYLLAWGGRGFCKQWLTQWLISVTWKDLLVSCELA